MKTNREILIDALCSADDADALAAVRKQAAAIREAMSGDGDLPLSAAQQAEMAKHPEWVGTVYGALFGDVDSSESEDTTIAQAIRQVREDEDTEIGEAFIALVTLLEDSRYDWIARFSALSTPDDLEMEHLREHGAVAAGGPQAISLLKHGITPAIIYEATRGLHLLFGRVERSLADAGIDGPVEDWLRNETPPDNGISLIGADGAAAHIPYPVVLAEIEGTPNILPGCAEPLWRWIGDVVEIQPFLIEGYAYDREARGFTRLQRLGIDIPGDLVAQWQWSHRAQAGARSPGIM